ncbi:hypothetical protein PMAYCL1PPCAC_07943, partial [Pristionchus mayeri]
DFLVGLIGELLEDYEDEDVGKQVYEADESCGSAQHESEHEHRHAAEETIDDDSQLVVHHRHGHLWLLGEEDSAGRGG